MYSCNEKLSQHFNKIIQKYLQYADTWNTGAKSRRFGSELYDTVSYSSDQNRADSPCDLKLLDTKKRNTCRKKLPGIFFALLFLSWRNIRYLSSEAQDVPMQGVELSGHVLKGYIKYSIQFNSIYLLIRQTCWHTTMLHKMKS